MKRSYVIYLTLLWAVAAHEDHGRTHSLAGKLCTKRGGTVCLTDHHANVEVDGDIALWKDTLGVSSQGSAACQIKSKMLLDLDTRTKRFCGEVDNMVHELRAPRFATDVVKAAGFRGQGDAGDMAGVRRFVPVLLLVLLLVFGQPRLLSNSIIT